MNRNIIINTRDGLKIIEVPLGTVHCQQVGIAPNGYEPGDEQYIYIRDGHLFFKHEEKWAADAVEHEAAAEKKAWNDQNPLDRIKKSFIG